MRVRASSVLFGLGGILIAGALTITCLNLVDENRAGETAGNALAELSQHIEVQPADRQPASSYQEVEIPDYLLNPDMEMPVQQVDGVDYIGTVSIPSVGIELPVISDWSYPHLKLAPCRYSGTVYKNDIIIAGHNYRTHFGKLGSVQVGDTVTFLDNDGNLFSYTVSQVETIDGMDLEAMTAEGDWDMTIFTCTLGGKSRVTLRCTRIDTDASPVY